MNKIVSLDFFNRKTKRVAKELLGKYLVRTLGTKKFSLMITEVEAYVGPHDLASHSSKRRTPRTEIMYMGAGTIYIYMIYGKYFMLNIVTESEGFPAAVLIRGVAGINGPGLVSQHLEIDKKLNGLQLSKSNSLWIEDRGTVIKSKEIVASARIGVAYAGEIWANKKLRYVYKPEN